MAFQFTAFFYLGQITGEDKDQQVTLDHLANASVQGLVATGPRRGPATGHHQAEGWAALRRWRLPARISLDNAGSQF